MGSDDRAPRPRKKFTDPTIDDEPRHRAPRPEIPDTHDGDGILRWSAAGTVVFVVAAVAGTVAPSPFVYVLVPVAVALFAVGIVTFLLAYAHAVQRSRTDLIGMGGLYFLAGTAPRRVQKHLLGALAVQTVVGFTAASIRIFTPVAFASLVPMFGLGLCGLWAARHGTFAPRPPGPEKRRSTTR